MKVVKGIRDIHAENQLRYQRLSHEACAVLKHKVEEKGWFFTHRLKELPSFALKLETGRVHDPTAPDDFFACTIVVQNLERINDAESLVLEHFEFNDRKPRIDKETLKEPFDFRFDDLRLYVSLRPNIRDRNVDLIGVIFEVQIKTVLQYAWGIATHDLIYKTDTVSWPKERIAFQVKAMLEHVETAIAEAEQMANSPFVAKIDAKTSNILKIISQLEQFWPEEALPEDRKRLAENILNVLKSANLAADQLTAFIVVEKYRNDIIPRDLSPYAFIVQALAHSEVINFKKLFNRNNVKTRILVHHDMDLPDWMKVAHKRIVYVSN
jgi:ppGpp synthetase/RelA/SpoT-type nucleotidyltranferase